MSRYQSSCLGLAMMLGAAGASANAQALGPDSPPTAARCKEPVARRVYQRDINNRATIPVALENEDGGVRVLGVDVLDGRGQPVVEGVKFDSGVLRGVPVGGPYTIRVGVGKDGGFGTVSVGPVFVGDLWVLAGQSNMEGVGDLIDVTSPDDRVMALGMDGQWARAEEPLHWLVDSPDPVHSGDPATREERSAQQHKTRRKGAGLGLPFGAAMVRATGVPVGLIACAHGGTSMAQWDPARKEDGGKSLYGSMMRQFHLAGGKVKGVLWYQGEAEANERAAEAYPKVFADFIGAVREDFGQPDLPFYLVQIGRFIRSGDPRGWNAVQETQRRIPERIPYTAVVSVVDLELDDLIHVGTSGLKRAGQRLAHVALHELFGLPLGTTPTLDKVAKGPNNTLVVKFKGVNATPAGFLAGGGMGGMGGGMMGGMGGGFRQMAVEGPHARGEYGLQPSRHIAGFSIRKEDGSEIPLIYEAAVGQARDTVVLKLVGPVPEGANLWYGWGVDPYCNLTDGLDMAVPVFGPLPLDEVK
jgi:hypothetical protein